MVKATFPQRNSSKVKQEHEKWSREEKAATVNFQPWNENGGRKSPQIPVFTLSSGATAINGVLATNSLEAFRQNIQHPKMSQSSLDDDWHIRGCDDESVLPTFGKNGGYRRWMPDGTHPQLWTQQKVFCVKAWILALVALIALLWVAVLFLLLLPSRNPDNFQWFTGDRDSDDSPVVNSRPIIGILAQEYKYYTHHPNGADVSHQKDSTEKSYIAASYVKYIEGAGAQVVPILIGPNYNETYLNYIFSRVNGILYPGGAVPLDSSSGYGKAGRYLYQLALEANHKGQYYPLWGTCLGFEFMMFVAAGYKEMRADCGAYNVANRLKFTEGAGSSRLYGKAEKSIIKSLGTKDVTVNFHKFCLTPENFTAFNIDKTYRILSVNYDSVSNLTYVSTVEAKSVPFYAVQFHPEKNIYEWTKKEIIPHTPEAITSAQYFANFFVNEARKNNNTFEDGAEDNYLIYNYQPEFTSKNGSTFEQLYFFDM